MISLVRGLEVREHWSQRPVDSEPSRRRHEETVHRRAHRHDIAAGGRSEPENGALKDIWQIGDQQRRGLPKPSSMLSALGAYRGRAAAPSATSPRPPAVLVPGPGPHGRPSVLPLTHWSCAAHAIPQISDHRLTAQENCRPAWTTGSLGTTGTRTQRQRPALGPPSRAPSAWPA